MDGQMPVCCMSSIFDKYQRNFSEQGIVLYLFLLCHQLSLIIHIQMQKIINIIIERIGDIKTVKNQLKKCKKKSEQEEPMNVFEVKRIKHVIEGIDRSENNRIKIEIGSFHQIESLKLISQKNQKYFIELSWKMFATYDGYFQEEINLSTINISQIYLLYKQFLMKYATSNQYNYILSFMRREKEALSPLIYLGWMGQWSKSLLHKSLCLLQKEISTQKPKGLRKSGRDKTHEQQQTSQELSIQSRQNLYGYLLNQMQYYYKMMNILDLDTPYILNLKKLGKKDELSNNNIVDAIDKLIKKNHLVTQNTIRKYKSTYEKYHTKIQSITVNHQSQESKPNFLLNKIKEQKINKSLIIDRVDKNPPDQPPIQVKQIKASLNYNFKKMEFPVIQKKMKYHHYQSKMPRLNKRIRTHEEVFDKKYFSHKNDDIISRGVKYQPLSILIISSPEQIFQDIKYQKIEIHNSLKGHVKYNLNSYDKFKSKNSLKMMNQKNAISFDDKVLKQYRGRPSFQSFGKKKNAFLL